MMRARAPLGGVVILVAVLAWQQSPAAAHHPEVRAANVCMEGVASIEITATAWETDLGADRRVNNDVRIDATGGTTDLTVGGLFVSPDFESRVVFEVPDAVGSTLTVRATAVAPWGANGEFGYAGTWRETTIAVVNVCPPPDGAATNAAPSPTTAAPPPTVTPVPLGPDEVRVLGATVTRAVPADVPDAVVLSQLAFTGDRIAPLALFGAAAMLAGALTLVATNRRRAILSSDTEHRPQ